MAAHHDIAALIWLLIWLPTTMVAPHTFLLWQVALKLVPMVFAPGEIAPAGHLYIVHRGIALFGGKVRQP